MTVPAPAQVDPYPDTVEAGDVQRPDMCPSRWEELRDFFTSKTADCMSPWKQLNPRWPRNSWLGCRDGPEPCWIQLISCAQDEALKSVLWQKIENWSEDASSGLREFCTCRNYCFLSDRRRPIRYSRLCPQVLTFSTFNGTSRQVESDLQLNDSLSLWLTLTPEGGAVTDQTSGGNRPFVNKAEMDDDLAEMCHINNHLEHFKLKFVNVCVSVCVCVCVWES